MSKQARLFEVADCQSGFFTAKQAVVAGFSAKHHYRWVKLGHWIREGHGIYRLAFYPLPDRPDLMRWYLWSRDQSDEPQGVFSHDSALAIHELSDLNPPWLHLTLPTGVYKRSPRPESIRLYHGRVDEADIEYVHRVCVTNSVRTILDLLLANHTEEYILLQAMNEGIERGLIPSVDALLNHPLTQKSKTLRRKVLDLIAWYEEAI